MRVHHDPHKQMEYLKYSTTYSWLIRTQSHRQLSLRTNGTLYSTELIGLDTRNAEQENGMLWMQMHHIIASRPNGGTQNDDYTSIIMAFTSQSFAVENPCHPR